ncbi:MAG: tetratricopeptide repeat protein [Myxococcota bacterium]
MRSSYSAHRILVLAGLLACGLLFAAAAHAQYDDPDARRPAPEPVAELSAEDRAKMERLRARDAERKKLRKKFILRSRATRLLTAAGEELEAEDGEAALAHLAKLNPKRLNPFERARVYLMRGYASYAAGSPAGAVENFRLAVQQEILQSKEEAGLRFNTAQLLAGQQKWPEVTEAIIEWFDYTLEPTPIAYYLLAVSYYQQEKPKDALAAAETAVDMSDEPKEGWLTLLAALYIQNEDYGSAIPVFEELVLRYPKKQYWVQLSLLWGARDNYRHALAVQQLAYKQGFLDDDKELVRLARSYLFHELPYPAAKVLQQGLEEGRVDENVDNLELLSNSWIAAREYEKSLAPLAQAAEMAPDGNLYVRLGQVYMQRENWGQAAKLLKKAISRGGLDNVGNAQLLLGIAYYNDKKVSQAVASFGRASRYEKSKRAAEGWITHIEREAAASGGGEQAAASGGGDTAAATGG